MSSIVVNIDVADFTGEGMEIVGTEDADRLMGTNDGELMDGRAGDDFVSGSDGNDFVIGGSGSDTLGGGDGNDTILGGIGDDAIFAFDGDDVVDAGAGNDTIYGNEGADIIFGGEGEDTFVFKLEDFADGSIDTVADFELGEDKFMVKGLSESDALLFDSALGTISVNGEEVVRFEDVDTTGEDFEMF